MKLGEINFQEGLEIHKKLFPRASTRSQLFQLNEELQELRNAEDIKNLEEELGDVLVVAVSLMRFDTTKEIARYILDKEYFNLSITERERRMKLFSKSIEKCKKRISDARYKFVNGLYVRDKIFYKR